MTEMAAASGAWPRWHRGPAKAAAPSAKPPDDWGKLEPDVVKEVVRQAELNLQQQAAVAQSIDQRATSLAALANAGAVAVLAFLGSQLAQGKADAPLIAGAVAVAATWCASSVCCYLTLAPAEWRSAGFWPSQLYRALGSEEYGVVERLGSLAEQLDDACRINDRRNSRAAKRLRWALWLAGGAPIVGPIFWAATFLLARAG